MKTTAKPHQLDFLTWQDGRRHLPVFAEKGTGKTWMAIAWLERTLHGRRALVVTDNSHVEQWVADVHKHSDGLRAVALVGSYEERKRLLQESDADIFVTNYQMLSSKAGGNLLVLQDWFAMVADESVNLKNSGSACTKAAIRIGDGVEYRMILSGEPVTNKLHDIWSQYRFVDGGKTFGRSFWDFRRQNFYPAGFEWRLKAGAKERIRRLIRVTSFRVLKSEACPELPEKKPTRVPVPMTAQQVKLTDEVLNEWRLLGPDGYTDVNYIVQKMTRLAQIASGFVQIKGLPLQRLHTLKPLYFNALLRTALQKHTGIIVWCRFAVEADDIAKQCERLKVQHVLAAGSVKVQPLVDRFQNDPKCRVFIGTLAKCARALTLTKASCNIYYNRDYSSDRKSQSEDRSHRIGSERHGEIEYHELYVVGSVEEKALHAVQSYREFAREILDKRPS